MIHFHASLVQFVGFGIATALFMGCGDDTNSNTQSSSTLGAGGASSSSGGDAGASQTWTGTPSGDALQIGLQVFVKLLSPPETDAMVSVLHIPTQKHLDGANVTLTPLGAAPITLSDTGDMTYDGSFPGDWAASYELNVEHPLGSRKGIIVTTPSKFSIAINPPPKADTPSTVTWTPFGEANVGVFVHIGNYSTTGKSLLMDTGSFEVPGTAFSNWSGNLNLEVLRMKLDVIPDDTTANVMVAAAQSGIKLEP